MIDVVVWCTGFQTALDCLEPLGAVMENGKVKVQGTHSVKEPPLWLVTPNRLIESPLT